jgi:hypothetical protein
MLDPGDLVGGFGAEMRERVDRLADLRFDQAAEFHHAGGDGVEFAVELGGEMFVGHVVLLQPKRPVM